MEPFAEDAAFRSDWRKVKQTRKQELAAWIEERTGIVVDPATLFDMQVKRIHEYKRQLLNILYVISLYNQIKKNPQGRHHSAHRDFWRKGRSRVLHGEADHQAHQLCRRRH